MAKIDKSLTESQNIAKLLKESNPRFKYSLDTLTFGQPQPSEEEGYNTSILAQAISEAPFTGSHTYNYNRLDLGVNGLDPALGTTLTVSEEDDEGAVQFKALAYFRLRQDSVTFGEYVPAGNEPGILEIISVTDSLLYLPSSVVIELVKSSEDPEDLADIADNTDLDGFDPESSVPTPEYVHDPIVEPAPVSSGETKPNGTLLNGTGNPATDMTVAYNGELSLATSGRLFQSQTTVAPVNNVYDLTLQDNQDWNFPISVALLNTDAGSVITDLYEVEFFIRNAQNNNEVRFKLVRTEGGYNWYSQDRDLTITDNSVSEDQTVVQNIQRARFYAEQLGVTEFNGFGAAMGEYDLGFVAKRIDTYIDPIETVVRVNASFPS